MSDVMEATPEVDETADAPERYAPEAEEISRRLAKARELGFTRPMFVALTGLTYSAMWRAEHDRAHPSEVEVLTAVLSRVEAGDFKVVRHGRGAARAEEVRPLTTGIKGVNSTTGTVHLARTKRVGDDDLLVQRCGVGSRQHAALTPVPDASELTCGRCRRLEESESDDASELAA